MRKWLWLRGPKRLWIHTHAWREDEQGRPCNGSLTWLARWVLS